MTWTPDTTSRWRVALTRAFALLLALGSSNIVLAQADSSRSLLVRPFAGVGVTSRSFDRPTADASQVFASAFVPAVETGLYVSVWPDSTRSLGVLLQYRTSLGLVVTEPSPFAVRNRLSVRSEQIELSIIPSVRLGESLGDPRLGLALGGCARTFWPSEHTLMTPGYTLLGPHTRIELIVPAFQRWTVRIAPEAQWIVAMDAALRRSGVAPQGVALGGEASLALALTPTWSAGLHYRESHAIASATTGRAFEDIERYLTLRVEGSL